MSKKKTMEQDLSPLARSMITAVVGEERLSKKEREPKIPSLLDGDPGRDQKEPPSLVKSIINVLNGNKEDSIERLAFETDPSQINTFGALYRAKLKLLPDGILKRIAIQDDLVAAVLNVRSNHLASFGRPRPNRHEIGYVIEPRPGVLDDCENNKKDEVRNRIKRAVELFSTCGSTEGWADTMEKSRFSQYLYMSTRNALTCGRIATEAIYVTDAQSGEKKFHSFRAMDGGTIYRAAPQRPQAKAVRVQALRLLEQLKNKKLQPERFMDDEYKWVQVIESKPVQAFTDEECLVYNLFPVLDVELDGYPLTPIDTMISAVTTHINIVNHNKLYFQNGRAARGALVIQSDDVDEKVLKGIRQQFNASINSVSASWRTPVFGVGKDDSVSMVSFDGSSRDMEFQYLSDNNARVILSAFQMSPEEIPGYAHLSRGANSQALSEGNQEYKLEAHRDVGIRPLLKNWEEFINDRLFPLIDPGLAKICTFRLVGLDAETAEKEATRLAQDAAVHMTTDQILESVEKEPLGLDWGGEFLINPQWQAILDKYVTVGRIQEKFFGVQGASRDPTLQFYCNPFWMQYQQLLMAQQQAQAAAAQPQQPQGQPPQGGGPGDGQQPQDPGQGQPQQPQGPDQQGQDLSRSLDQAIHLLTKTEAQLPPSKRKLLAQHRATVDHVVSAWEKDLEAASAEIQAVATRHQPKAKKAKS